MENHHAINGKTHYFYGPFSIAMLNYQWLLAIGGIPWYTPFPDRPKAISRPKSGGRR